jgi:group I intron endonuclease
MSKIEIKSRFDTGVCKIYLLTNIANNKIYVGQSWMGLNDRMGRDGNGYFNSPYLYNAIKKYGVDKFEYQILDFAFIQSHADMLEDFYMNKYDSRNPNIGYNIKRGGRGGRHSQATIEKMSKNAPKYWLGKNLSEETKEKIRIANTGKIRTEETKEMTANSMKEWHATNDHPMQGKHHTEKAKDQMSEKLTGRKISKETIEKRMATIRDLDLEKKIIEEYQKGTKVRGEGGIEDIFNISAGKLYRILKLNNIPKSNNFSKWTGKSHSQETKSKMSQSATELWDNRKNSKD